MFAIRNGAVIDRAYSRASVDAVCDRAFSTCIWLCAWLVFIFPEALLAQTAWNFVGPAGGAPPRVVRLASDPRSDSVLYFAAPGGGVWNSTNGGSSWFPVADSLPSFEVCSIAIDSSSPDVLYVGTGDDQNPRPLQTVARSPDGGRTCTRGRRFTNQPAC